MGRGDEPMSARNGPRSARNRASREPRPERGESEPEDDENFLFHLYRGSELLQDGREHEAKEELEQALLRKPGDQKGQDLLAAVYFRVGHFARAIAIYEQLQESSPRDPALQLNLALCHLKSDAPEQARAQLLALVAESPDHLRAWGYLGLCHERLGELGEAQAAFEKSGHGHLARRVMEQLAARKGATHGAPTAPPAPAPAEGTRPAPGGLHDLAAAAEAAEADQLDAAGAAPAAPWQHASSPLEPGPELTEAPDAPPPATPRSTPTSTRAHAILTHPPSTRDGPPPPPALPRPAPPPPSVRAPRARDSAPPSVLPPVAPPSRRAIPAAPPTPEPPTRRKTLIVGPPPPGAATAGAELAPVSLRLPSSQRLPTIEEPALSWSAGRLVSTPPGAVPAPSVFPPPSAAHFARAAALVAPGDGAVSLHASGVVVARPTVAVPFATRLESIRAMSGALDSKILERKQRGASLGETFGGLGSPLVELVGEGHLVVGPKPGHTLWSFTLDGAPCSVREDRVLGFQLSLAYENERVALGSAELGVVRFAGAGALVLETSSALVTLAVTPASAIVVRREVVVGWLGVLDITPVLPADAPGAHHGLVRFQGEGSVFVSGL